jgi:hypothetical protein
LPFVPTICDGDLHVASAAATPFVLCTQVRLTRGTLGRSPEPKSLPISLRRAHVPVFARCSQEVVERL